MKIYINSIKENWIVDRVKKEWEISNPTYNTQFSSKADIIWLIAPWTWKKVSKKNLLNKKVVCSFYHIDEEKFTTYDLDEFKDRDSYVDFYHTISKKSEIQLQKLTNKPIFVAPFWVNQDIFFDIPEKYKISRKLAFSPDEYLIGSFQRDTEGSDLISPKLSKGPDRFIKIVEHYRQINPNVAVVLTGKRRNYVITQLKAKKIKFYYFEMVDFVKLNELYNCLDLYIVSSRYEGGPQAILECAITNTPVISTDVGIASEILSKNSIYNMETFKDASPDTVKAFNNVSKLTLPQGMDTFFKNFMEVYES